MCQQLQSDIQSIDFTFWHDVFQIIGPWEIWIKF